MKRFVLCFMVAWTLIAASPALASDGPPEGWGAASLRVAHEYWGLDPVWCETTEIRYEDVLPEPNALGQATVPTLYNRHCVMWIRNGLNVLIQCQVYVHEYGHWLGLMHSADPYNVMYPYSSLSNTPERCIQLLEEYQPDWSTRALKWLG